MNTQAKMNDLDPIIAKEWKSPTGGSYVDVTYTWAELKALFDNDSGVVGPLMQRCEGLAAENKRLKAALQRYGRHEDGCVAIRKVVGWNCQCGYHPALYGEELARGVWHDLTKNLL